jgi:medium-chain acyl-[acyl-carrier-protein] hydrolase
MGSMSGEEKNKWLPFRKTASHATLRLLCLPHAGGGAASFRAWGEALAPELEVLAVEYPGRLSRHHEEPVSEVGELVSRLADGLERELCGRYALFGFSFGSLLAFELAREIRRRRLPEPQHLFVAARGAPQLRSPYPPIHQLPDAAFLERLALLYGELPAAIRASPELLRMAMRPLRADLTALERYVFRDEAPFGFPLSALGGSHDPVAGADVLAPWKVHTVASFQWRQFAGGHFFLNEASGRLFAYVREQLAGPSKTPLSARVAHSEATRNAGVVPR